MLVKNAARSILKPKSKIQHPFLERFSSRYLGLFGARYFFSIFLEIHKVLISEKY